MNLQLIPFLFRTLSPLYQFLYPPVCLVCSSRLHEGDRRVCSSCWTAAGSLLAESALYRVQHERVISYGCAGLVGLYQFQKDGTIQAVIHQLKYGGMTSLGLELGRRLGQRLLEDQSLPDLDGVIPVPLHRSKERERGYNQSLFLARGLCEVTGLPLLPELLLRARHTASQTHLSADERRVNVEGAFRVPAKHVPFVCRERFLLVDDVLTTGATMASCTHALAAAGSMPPIACVVALAE